MQLSAQIIASKEGVNASESRNHIATSRLGPFRKIFRPETKNDDQNRVPALRKYRWMRFNIAEMCIRRNLWIT